VKTQLFILGLVLTVACGKVSDKLGEQAQIDIEKNNQDIAAKVAAAEADLSRRHRFYQGTAGIYDGKVIAPGGETARARVTLVPTIYPYTGSRQRTLDEVSSDLTNLAFQFVFTLYDIGGSNTYATCKSQQVPDLENGRMTVADGCVLTLGIFATSKLLTIAELPNILNFSQLTAKSLLEGQISDSKHLTIYAESQASQVNYWMHLSKSSW
jgi:hypothetical protein